MVDSAIQFCSKLGLISLIATTLVGCATSDTGPFHVYGSPLLQADDTHVYARERSFDPLGMGDFVATPDTAVAKREEPTPRRSPARKPALKETRVGSSNNKNGARANLPSLSTRKTTVAKATTPVAAKKLGVGADAAEYVWAVYAVNGVELPASAQRDMTALYKGCKKAGKITHSSRPKAGDVVFFHNTLDSNKDGRNNDWYTYAAIVESVDKSGTVTAIGWDGEAVSRVQLNLEVGEEAEVDGAVVNSRLRNESSNDAPFTQYFAHQLFAGFCSALGDRKDVIVVDNWTPGTAVNAP